MFITWMMDSSPGQLTRGVRKFGCPVLRFKNACKHELKAREIDPNNWEDAACDRACSSCLTRKLRRGAIPAKTASSFMAAKTALSSSSSCFICVVCSRDCHSHIGNVVARPRIAKGAQALFLKTSPVSDPPFIYPLVTNRYSFRLSLTTITMMMMSIIIIVIIIIVIMTNDQKFEKKKTNTSEQIRKINSLISLKVQVEILITAKYQQ